MPKRDATALIEALRVRALALTGTEWERNATRDMINEAAQMLEDLTTKQSDLMHFQDRTMRKDRMRIYRDVWITATERADVVRSDIAGELLEAVAAGGRYAVALLRCQDDDELDRLFMDWFNKSAAAIAKAEGQ